MLSGEDFPEGFRIGTGLQGFAMGPSRQPATEGQQADRRTLAEDVLTRLRAFGLDRSQPGRAIAC